MSRSIARWIEDLLSLGLENHRLQIQETINGGPTTSESEEETRYMHRDSGEDYLT